MRNPVVNAGTTRDESETNTTDDVMVNYACAASAVFSMSIVCQIGFFLWVIPVIEMAVGLSFYPFRQGSRIPLNDDKEIKKNQNPNIEYSQKTHLCRIK